MTISLKADVSGTFGEVLVNGSPALKVSNGLLELADGKDFFNQGNIIGTVSQSGGVPTGAVVERGSNANGEYVRFADGTQICTKSSLSTVGGPTIATGSIYRDGGSTWTFPAAFVVGVHAWCGGNQSNTRWVSHNSSVANLTSHNFTVFNTISEATRVPLHGLCAIGRWY